MSEDAPPVIVSIFTRNSSFFRIETRQSGDHYLVASFNEEVRLDSLDLDKVRKGCDALSRMLKARDKRERLPGF